ncbi:Type-4 uracil-DNA glycosylase [Phycisphaerales bacterium]|nr:Type-4 uracil-DNA glycosylase [Phycisphaerales bacterium]
MEDLAARLVRQHAETARLLGVDFVPAYKPPGVENQASEPPVAVVTPAAVALVTPATAAAPDLPRDRDASQRALDELRARYESDAPHKQFVTAHTRIVWGEGDPCARLVFVGEAPGEEEDKTGRPFVGRAGHLLNKMITGMGLQREQAYICNILKTRPPDNATPTGREIELCEPYLRDQLAIISPEVIVCLGLPASRALLRSEESMTRMRGRWRTYTLANGRQVPVMPTYHPAYVLRNYTVETRALVWSDLVLALERLGLKPPQKEAQAVS